MFQPPHNSASWDVLYVAAGSVFFVGAIGAVAKLVPHRHEGEVPPGSPDANPEDAHPV